ncbi:MbcA/ParS/Xre antitoxin family protein [Vibrio hangzhouensis]|uniref:MbcA/ParS/Xre antitoxin family protein n=1 Tax=Vibrio hangzhouensis TaxID=462991 RepID=UPI001C95F8ED|nr:MbcA/ParS/Xre antitoxin family protein [Vibrio hangzhouensis]MBY6198702.1 MbcA/ParS/Xre antitoxin family protein [Vibrio hangzhouensis]
MRVGVNITSEQRSKALSVALRILDKWQCSDREKATLLGLEHEWEDREEVSDYTLERISYILNIHKALRKTFSSDETIYDWVRKPNTHPTLSGTPAIDFMKHRGNCGLSTVMNLAVDFSS